MNFNIGDQVKCDLYGFDGVIVSIYVPNMYEVDSVIGKYIIHGDDLELTASEGRSPEVLNDNALHCSEVAPQATKAVCMGCGSPEPLRPYDDGMALKGMMCHKCGRFE